MLCIVMDIPMQPRMINNLSGARSVPGNFDNCQSVRFTLQRFKLVVVCTMPICYMQLKTSINQTLMQSLAFTFGDRCACAPPTNLKVLCSHRQPQLQWSLSVQLLMHLLLALINRFIEDFIKAWQT